jgi:carboxypeptidase C (cathepsin A)
LELIMVRRFALAVCLLAGPLLIAAGLMTGQWADATAEVRPGSASTPAKPAAATAWALTPNAPRARRLPADAVTTHTLDLGTRQISFSATAGTIALENANGVVDAEIAYIAFTRPGEAARTRPITFAINGGPGSASAWLNIGGLGPWRLPMEKGDIQPSAVPDLVANGETWLDFTDLVFIDPVGTGFSRLVQAGFETTPGAQPSPPPATSSTAPKSSYYSVGGDIDSLSTFIRRYLTNTDRLQSPKILVGESYAGFRAPKIAAKLQASGGIGFNALVIVSPVLDFAWLNGATATNPVPYLDTLPSFAAANRERKGAITRADLADVEAYASGEFLVDLMRGERDRPAVERIVANVAKFSGLDPALVKQRNGRVDAYTFMRESKRADGRVVSIYEGTVGALDPFPSSGYSRFEDAFSGALAAPVTSAMLDLYRAKLNWRPEGEYQVLSMAVNRAWDWGSNGRASHEAVGDLQRALALDPTLDVVIAHGMTDLITPYFRSKLIIDQLPPLGDPSRLRLAVYPGGHMFYARAGSRAEFRATTAATIDTIVRARTRVVP